MAISEEEIKAYRDANLGSSRDEAVKVLRRRERETTLDEALRCRPDRLRGLTDLTKIFKD